MLSCQPSTKKSEKTTIELLEALQRRSNCIRIKWACESETVIFAGVQSLLQPEYWQQLIVSNKASNHRYIQLWPVQRCVAAMRMHKAEQFHEWSCTRNTMTIPAETTSPFCISSPHWHSVPPFEPLHFHDPTHWCPTEDLLMLPDGELPALMFRLQHLSALCWCPSHWWQTLFAMQRHLTTDASLPICFALASHKADGTRAKVTAADHSR